MSALTSCTSQSYRLAGVQAFVVARTAGQPVAGELQAVQQVRAGQQAGIVIRLHHEVTEDAAEHVFVSQIESVGIEADGDELLSQARVDTSLALACPPLTERDTLPRVQLATASVRHWADLNSFVQGYNQHKHTDNQLILWLPADYAPRHAQAFEVVLRLADGGMLFTRTGSIQFQ